MHGTFFKPEHDADTFKQYSLKFVLLVSPNGKLSLFDQETSEISVSGCWQFHRSKNLCDLLHGFLWSFVNKEVNQCWKTSVSSSYPVVEYQGTLSLNQTDWPISHNLCCYCIHNCKKLLCLGYRCRNKQLFFVFLFFRFE